MRATPHRAWTQTYRSCLSSSLAGRGVLCIFGSDILEGILSGYLLAFGGEYDFCHSLPRQRHPASHWLARFPFLETGLAQRQPRSPGTELRQTPALRPQGFPLMLARATCTLTFVRTFDVKLLAGAAVSLRELRNGYYSHTLCSMPSTKLLPNPNMYTFAAALIMNHPPNVLTRWTPFGNWA